jgi:hypothetical protein
VVLYDVTTLHFEAEREDKLRKVGMSKERRVDPQVQVGLLVDRGGFPLEVHCFSGNTAETSTLLPVLEAFRERHQATDLVVVADAGMLSAKNLNAIEDAGLSFVVGSRISRAPYDLAEHFERHGNAFTDGQVLESARVMGSGKAARSRRVVYQWRFARHKHDDRAINAMVERAEKVAAGTRALKKDRFVRLDSGDAEVDWGLVERARQLAGLKGYVTNLPESTMDGPAVVAAYHDLWQVEKSFRMAKSDLRARPMFHHEHDSIEAHLPWCSPPSPSPDTSKTPPASRSRTLSAPCAPSAPRPSASAAKRSPSTPTSPPQQPKSSTGYPPQVTNEVSRLRFEGDALQVHERALNAGHHVIYVPVRSDGQQTQVVGILRSAGGYALLHFRRWSVELLPPG